MMQAGGGVVWDSVERDEWEETVSKLKGNVAVIEQLERI